MKNLLAKNLFLLILLLSLFSAFSFAQTQIEQEILKEINTVRQNPQIYIAHLEEFKKLFRGKTVEYPENILMTNEGTSAVDEAIKFLQKQAKLEPLTYSAGLTKPAKLQLNDLLENYSLGHTGKDGSDLPKRISRFGKYNKLASENVIDQMSNPKDIVMLMIVDDGVKSRGHRKNIFNKTFKLAGVAYEVNSSNMPVTVMVFADSFVEK